MSLMSRAGSSFLGLVPTGELGDGGWPLGLDQALELGLRDGGDPEGRLPLAIAAFAHHLAVTGLLAREVTK